MPRKQSVKQEGWVYCFKVDPMSISFKVAKGYAMQITNKNYCHYFESYDWNVRFMSILKIANILMTIFSNVWTLI